MPDLSWLTNILGPAFTAGAGIYDTAVNKEIADKNLAFQQQQFQYQQELNQLQMEREDTAYQRSVADMQKAGLSPLNANPASAGTLNAGTAPQNNFQSNIGNIANNTMNTLTNLMNLSIAKKQAEANIQKTESETALNTQALAELDRTNPITRDILNAQLSGILADNIAKNNQNDIFNSITKHSLFTDLKLKELDYARRYNDFNYMRFYGLTDSMSAAERIAAFKRHLKNGNGDVPYDRLFPNLIDNKDNSYSYGGLYKDFAVSQNNEFVSKVIDKDLLNMWQLIVGTLTGVGGLGK